MLLLIRCIDAREIVPGNGGDSLRIFWTAAL
jgi:hypothetical protein